MDRVRLEVILAIGELPQEGLDAVMMALLTGPCYDQPGFSIKTRDALRSLEQKIQVYFRAREVM